MVSMTSQVPLHLQTAVFNLIAFMGSPNITKASMQNPYNPGLLGWMPGEPLDQPGITSWKINGYNYSDVASYAKALEATLALPGTAMDFRVAGGPALSTPLLASVIAVPVGLCLAVMALLLVIITHLRRNAKLQRSLMGHVLPPAAGDKATLVITDVQGSSKLWETLPAGVMEASMKVHDEVVRRLALNSSGYEWATEGDSFLLCFHTPQAAVAFATQLQAHARSGLVAWQRLCALYREVEVEEPAALTVLAGLRVRVGMHTGLAADEVLVQSRMGASSTTYGGAALVLAKAVQACAHGGQVTLSAATFVKLPVEELRAAGISVVHMGKHLLELGEGKGDTALDLYCATLDTPAHAHRLWALGPLRTARQLQPGVLQAPYGVAATVFMSVVGLAQLKAWDASLAKECLALYQATAQRVLLHVAGRQLPAGYLVSAADEDGMVLAAFSSSLQCLHWALLTLTTCMDLDWPQALLDSLLGEEMMTEQQGNSYTTATDSSAAAGSSTAGFGQAGCSTVTPSHSVRLLRGLRLKAGVDVGEVACDLTPANGRFNYRGRCLNRAARINGLAASGQGQPLALPGLLPSLVARPLGSRELRGIPGQVALVQVSLAAHTSRGQAEAADRLGLMAPGLQLS
ncbi:guanylyl and adenylyl cyclase family member [Haematococcus lacustris]|uniref:Guanylyl and adenylyl cyclase family member n=1 Tax=Haematococcus lacustris TaxID=44745 RepID=A0A699ZDD3_HAELA|nr:guanylyl and adenylyl cyclase family member [Haematococcus lacustris]